jgi:tetratricopeptide (TPR) repeat protein
VTTCSVCGDTSELEYGYTAVKSATGRAMRCVTCWKRGRERRELAVVMLPFATVVTLALLSGRWQSGLPTIRIYPVLLLVLWVHELGHAAVGRALGLRVFEIVLGSGPRLARARLGRTDVEARLFPFGGHTMMVPPRAARVRLALGIAAGPLANLALAVVTLVVWPRSGSWVPPLVIANAIVLIGNLWPMQVATPLGPVRSDGLALAMLIRSPRHELDDADALLHAAESRAALTRGEPSDAVAWAEAGLLAHPDHRPLRHYLTVALIRAGDVEAAREHLRALLACDDAESPERAIDLSNLAWADLMSGDPALLDEALTASEEAERRLAWHPAVKNTRGYALIESGRVEEGLVRVRRAYEAHTDRRDRAATACVAAIGAMRKGDVGAARSMLVAARRLDPGCELLERAAAEVEGATARVG